jgi:hypothetical protein
MLTAHHLRFTLKAETTIELDQHQGSALRGMLYNALRGPQRNPALGFCTQRHLKTCAECTLVAVCPVASLVATLNPEADRGRDIPRPYAIVPPLLPKTRYEAGEPYTFGLTLFGHALNLFPYVVMALRQAGPYGLGKAIPRPDSQGRPYRGRFTLESAQALNLLSGEVQDILAADSLMVQRPNLPVTHDQIVEHSRRLISQPLAASANGHHDQATYQYGQPPGPLAINLTFKTPTRIIEQGQLLKTPHFSPLFHRLLDRLIALAQAFGPEMKTLVAPPTTYFGNETTGTTPETLFDKKPLLALADQVELVNDQTRWQELWSYSARQGKQTPIGGLVGQATYRAAPDLWQHLLPCLLWGSIVHVGKNAVKGDGIVMVSC